MTMDERRAKAVEALQRGDPHVGHLQAVNIVDVVMGAAFPELHGDKPTHWLAPMEVTKEMVSAGEDALEDYKDSDWSSGIDGSSYTYEFFRSGHAKGMFDAMRDAYLGKGDGG